MIYSVYLFILKPYNIYKWQFFPAFDFKLVQYLKTVTVAAFERLLYFVATCKQLPSKSNVYTTNMNGNNVACVNGCHLATKMSLKLVHGNSFSVILGMSIINIWLTCHQNAWLWLFTLCRTDNPGHACALSGAQKRSYRCNNVALRGIAALSCSQTETLITLANVSGSSFERARD